MNIELNNNRRKKIGFLLQHERKCQRLGQEVFALKMDTRQESISRMEAGKRGIDIIDLIEYAEVMGFSLTEIAWKIETYLSGHRLLPLPKTTLLGKKIRVEVSWREKGFSASLEDIVPDEVVFTADTFDELRKVVEEFYDSHIEGLVPKGEEVPQWFVMREFEYKFLDARSLLNAYCPYYVSLVAISRVTGINQNLLSQYANGQKNAKPNQLKRIAEAIQKISKELSAVGV